MLAKINNEYNAMTNKQQMSVEFVIGTCKAICVLQQNIKYSVFFSLRLHKLTLAVFDK